MNKEWYAFIDGMQEGPFSPSELRHHPKITPDTLVRKTGSHEWRAIRFIPELQDIFQDDIESDFPEKDEPVQSKGPIFLETESEPDALALQRDPFQFFLWLLVVLLFILYIIFQTVRHFE